jgi:phenylacetate-CoA ligase
VIADRLSVIAPAYNEAPNLPELVDRLLAVFDRRELDGEIVLVDDGSTDGTSEVVDRLAAEHERVVAVHHARNQGIAEAWQTGLDASSGELVCIIDSDLQYLPEDVWRLYRTYVGSPVDMVQGHRSSLNWNRDLRFRLSRGLNVLLNRLFAMDLEDNKSGFVVCHRDVLADVLRSRRRYRYFQSFITVAAESRATRSRRSRCSSSRAGSAPRSSRASRRGSWPASCRTCSRPCSSSASGAWPRCRARSRPTWPAGPVTAGAEPMPLSRRARFAVYIALMPLHHWFITREAGKRYRELRDSQWLSPAEVRRLQETKLEKLMHHAYGHVPYYREVFDRAGLKPTDVKTIDDLQRLPLLEKSHVREHLYFDLLSDNHRKKDIQKIATSGSTGEPFVCYVDRHQLEMRWAATLRGMEYTGWRFGDRQVRLWHQTIGMSKTQVMRERIDAFFHRRKFVPAYEMTEANLPQAIAGMEQHDPALIDGYAESLNLLARYLERNPSTGLRPRGVITSAQVLPPQSREAIEREFGCRVFDKYGAREFSGIAWECDAHSGHHVVAENYIVEILRDGRPAAPGELGEVVITDLNNYCMPFIRYRIGDLAVAMDPRDQCPCGRGLPRVGSSRGACRRSSSARTAGTCRARSSRTSSRSTTTSSASTRWSRRSSGASRCASCGARASTRARSSGCSTTCASTSARRCTSTSSSPRRSRWSARASTRGASAASA